MCFFASFVAEPFIVYSKQATAECPFFLSSQAYVRHIRWPNHVGNFDGDGGILDILATWSSLIIELSVLFIDAGGPPEPLRDHSSAHAGLFASVVPVFDDDFGTQRDHRTCISKQGSVSY